MPRTKNSNFYIAIFICCSFFYLAVLIVYLMYNFHFIVHSNIMKKSKLKKLKNKPFGSADKFDINGSYTGTSGLLSDLNPVQDADDL